jgi:hypothetical protein
MSKCGQDQNEASRELEDASYYKSQNGRTEMFAQIPKAT